MKDGLNQRIDEPDGKIKGLLWLVVALATALLLTGGLPLIAKGLPWSFEEKIAKLTGGYEDDVCQAHPDRTELLQKIVRRLDPISPADHEFPLTVQVLKKSDINAFAFLGGHVYVFNGLLKKAGSASELAGVLAHEIEHVKRRHIAQGVLVSLMTIEALSVFVPDLSAQGRQLSHSLLTMKFGRDQEHEADEGGLRRLQAAHIDVLGFQHFFERMAQLSSPPTLLSDHPSSEDRLQLVKKYLGGQTEPVLTTAEFQRLQSICD